MIEGIFITIGVGILWILIVIIMSRVASTGIFIFAFFGIASGLTALVAWVLIVDWQALLAGTAARLPELVLWISLTGALNAAAQALVVGTMRRGHMGMTWAVSQTAIIIPFVGSVLIWRETPGLTGWCGVGCILAAIAVLAREHGSANDPSRDRLWLPLALLTFLTLGLAQLLLGVPSHWTNCPDSARLRIPILLSTGTVVHVLIIFIKRIHVDIRILPLCLAWTALGLVSLIGLFKCFDIMAQFGLAGIVYPLAVGTSIVGFSIYSHIRLREMYTRTTMAGLSVAIIGIILIACR